MGSAGRSPPDLVAHRSAVLCDDVQEGQHGRAAAQGRGGGASSSDAAAALVRQLAPALSQPGRGLQVDRQNNNGVTPLMAAARDGCTDIVNAVRT